MPKSEVVLVTGADGFIGSHLVELLLSKGYSVRALSQYNSFNFHGWLEDVPAHKKLSVVSGDVRDPFFCDELLDGVNTVFHLAALIAIPYSYKAPSSYIETNVNGTLNVCQAALKHKVGRLVQTSTSEVYGTAQYTPIDEKHMLQAQSPYSASKIGADAVATSFYHAYGLPVTIARPFNNFGPRQSLRAVIPTIISQIHSGNSTIKLGDTSPTRDFTYVTDTCAALCALAESKKAVGETVNIGSGKEISIGDLVDVIADLMGAKVTVKQDKQRLRPETSEVRQLLCDSSKLKDLTGFKCSEDLQSGLEKTIKWYQQPEHQAKFKHELYNV